MRGGAGLQGGTGNIKILKAIAKLKPDKSQGPDELSPKLLIETGNEIAYPLLLLVSKWINSSARMEEGKCYTYFQKRF